MSKSVSIPVYKEGFTNPHTPTQDMSAPWNVPPPPPPAPPGPTFHTAGNVGSTVHTWPPPSNATPAPVAGGQAMPAQVGGAWMAVPSPPAWPVSQYTPSTLTTPMPSMFRDDPFFQQHQGQMERTWRDMQARMREMENLFPWHLPGQFRPGIEPSALAPRVDDKNYVVQVQASDYKPNEITVKTVNRQGHDFLVVEGKHETTDQHGYHSVHHFKRQFMIPQNVDPESFSSKLDANGMLYIQAPVRQAIEDGARNIPVQRR